jgi:hypothetical protein
MPAINLVVCGSKDCWEMFKNEINFSFGRIFYGGKINLGSWEI